MGRIYVKGAFVVPVLQDRAPELVNGDPPGLANVGLQISLFTFFIGLLLFGIMTAIKGILPRWAAILLISYRFSTLFLIRKSYHSYWQEYVLSGWVFLYRRVNMRKVRK